DERIAERRSGRRRACRVGPEQVVAMLTASTILAPWVLGAALLAQAPIAAPAARPIVAPVVVSSVVVAFQKDKSDKDKEKADREKDKQDRWRMRDRDRGPEQTERLTRTFTVGANGRLFLNNIAGNITIKGVPGGDIRVEALKHGKGSSDEDARA